MAKKWQLILVWSLVFLALIGIRSRRSDDDISVYHGKTAQQWLGELRTTNQMQAFDALRRIGSNAVPVIIDAFAKKDSALDRFYQRNYSKLPRLLQSHLARPMPDNQRWATAEMAAVNIWQAKTAIPDFTRILADGNSRRQICVLGAILNFIGPDDTNSVPELVECLRSPDRYVRRFTAISLARIGPGAKAAVSGLTDLLKDDDLSARMSAAWALWKIDRQTNTATTALKEILMISSVPIEPTKSEAAVYLSEIDASDLSGMPVLIEALQHASLGTQLSAAQTLEQIGPAAKAAIPALVQAAQNNDPGLKQSALSALKRIDPELANKYEH